MARRADQKSRTQLTAFANLVFIVDDTVDPENPPTFLSVGITNTGIMPLRIPYSHFVWKNVFQWRGYMLIRPMDGSPNEWFPQKHYPIEIAPRASETLYLSSETMFLDEAKRMKAANASFLGKLGIRFIRAYVQTDDGAWFRVKLAKQVRDGWRQA